MVTDGDDLCLLSTSTERVLAKVALHASAAGEKTEPSDEFPNTQKSTSRSSKERVTEFERLGAEPVPGVLSSPLPWGGRVVE